MGDDEYKALRWLLGRGTRTETVRTIDGRRVEQHIGEIGARAALVRVLRSSSPSLDVLNVLASAFESVGSSEMRLELVLVRRAGRGRPRKDVLGAIEKLQDANKIDAEIESGSKPYIAVEDAAKKAGRARSTMYEAKKVARVAKAVREGKN
jgi:hypothetical protein